MSKIFAHGSYIGNTGYNNHTREVFRHLSKHSQIKFRNFTIGNEWNGMNDEPDKLDSLLLHKRGKVELMITF